MTELTQDQKVAVQEAITASVNAIERDTDAAMARRAKDEALLRAMNEGVSQVRLARECHVSRTWLYKLMTAATEGDW